MSTLKKLLQKKILARPCFIFKTKYRVKLTLHIEEPFVNLHWSSALHILPGAVMLDNLSSAIFDEGTFDKHWHFSDKEL